jgi:superfamily II DNA or RNA helicase
VKSELWPHQAKAIDMLRQSLATGHRRPMLQLATGAGKTRIAAEIIDSAFRKGRRTVFVVPVLELINQTVERFEADGIRDVGVIQGIHERTNFQAQVQIASAQTLERRFFPETDLVLVDEAHIHRKVILRWMGGDAMKRVPFIGLSATPWTRGLGKFYDDLICPVTMQELIDAGRLTPFRVFAPSHPDLTGVRTLAGDFRDDDLSAAMDKPHLVADVVKTWLEMGEGRPTLVFAVDRPHAKSLQQSFLAAGVEAGYVDGFSTPEERKAIKEGFADGTLKVVCNVGVLTMGVDWDVRCVVLARPTKSEMLYTQIIGRGLRLADGKVDCIVLDHSDTTLRLGFVSEIHHPTLDTGAPKNAEAGARKDPEAPKPKECPKCKFVKPVKVHECPNCGFKPERQTDVRVADGQLNEFAAVRAAADRELRQRWYSMLVHAGQTRGRQSGWAKHVFHRKFGCWPDSYSPLPRPPDAEVLRWIKRDNMRYVMGMKKAGRR